MWGHLTLIRQQIYATYNPETILAQVAFRPPHQAGRVSNSASGIDVQAAQEGALERYATYVCRIICDGHLENAERR